MRGSFGLAMGPGARVVGTKPRLQSRLPPIPTSPAQPRPARVTRHPPGSTVSTLPATFCPCLNFFRPLALPRSEACSVGTSALRGGGGGATRGWGGGAEYRRSAAAGARLALPPSQARRAQHTPRHATPTHTTVAAPPSGPDGAGELHQQPILLHPADGDAHRLARPQVCTQAADGQAVRAGGG